MNAVWNSYGQLCGCPEIFKKSCKFFCRELDIRVPQDMHFALSTRTRNSANRLIGFKNTVTGQIYLQNALLSRQIYANAMPTA